MNKPWTCPMHLTIKFIGVVLVIASLCYAVFWSLLFQYVQNGFLPIIFYCMLMCISGVGLLYLKKWAWQMAIALLIIYSVISAMQAILLWQMIPPDVFYGDIKQLGTAKKVLSILYCIGGVTSLIFIYILSYAKSGMSGRVTH